MKNGWMKAAVLMVALFSVMLTGALAVTQGDFYRNTWNGGSIVTGSCIIGGHNWCLVEGTGLGIPPRNATFVFNLTNYSGRIITLNNITTATAIGESWTPTGQPQYNDVIFGYIEFSDTPDSAPTATSRGTVFVATNNSAWPVSADVNVSQTGFYFNNFAFKWNGAPFTVNHPYMKYTIAFDGGIVSANRVTGTVANNGNTSYSATMNFEDGGQAAPLNLAYYPPVDRVVSNTLSTANLNTLLLATRPSAGTEIAYNLITDRGINHYAKRVYTANDLNSAFGRTFIGQAFNDSTTSYPNFVRGLVQVNDSIYISGRMPKTKDTLVNIIGLVYDRYYSSPTFSTVYGAAWTGKMHYYEINTDTTGNKPFYCWLLVNQVPTTTSTMSVKTVCGAPGGTANANDKVTLKYENGTTIMDATSSLSTKEEAAEFIIDRSEGLHIIFDLNSRADIDENVSLSSIGSVETTGTQTYGGGYVISRQVRSPSGNFLVIPGMQTSVSALDGVLGTSIYSVTNSFGTGNGNDFQSTNLLNTYFGSATSNQPVIALTYLKDGSGTDMQTGTMAAFDTPASSGGASLVIGCPEIMSNVISGVPFNIPCSPVSVTAQSFTYGTMPFSGRALSSCVTVTGYNQTQSCRIAASQASINSIAVTKAVGGTAVPATFLNGILTLTGVTTTVSGAVLYQATAQTDLSGGTPITQFFSINYNLCTSNCGAGGQGTPNDHKVYLVSTLTNLTGQFNLPNMTMTISGNTSCTTQITSVQDAALINGTTRVFAICTLNIPTSLTALPVTFTYDDNGTIFTATINNTFYGTYLDNSDSFIGIKSGDKATAFFVDYNTLLNRTFVLLGSGTCASTSTTQNAAGQNEFCTTLTCPQTKSIDSVVDISGITKGVTHFEFACSSAGQTRCVVDGGAKIAYVGTCGNLCEVTTRVCPSAACNSDATGCSGEIPASQIDSGTAEWMASSPLIAFVFGNMAFIVGLILIIAISAYLAMNVSGAMAGIVGGFLLLGLIVLVLPGGFLILLLVAAIVVSYILYQAYAGITGFQMK